LDETAGKFAAEHVRPMQAEADNQRTSPEDNKLHATILGAELAQKTSASDLADTGAAGTYPILTKSVPVRENPPICG
ncbi:MAG: hypothetical protein ACR2RE_07455, partial [Geminicoccaceae bacterium]